AESYGSITSHTLKFAAGALEDTRSVTFGVPEMCTVSLKIGVAYSKRCVDCSALASALPLIATSSTSLSEPLDAPLNARLATPVPPAVGCKTTGTDPGTGNDANGVGSVIMPRPRPRPRPAAGSTGVADCATDAAAAIARGSCAPAS